MNILLGYEIGTGKEVKIPLHHIVVTGVTQLSGKTTTLEALIERSGLKALAFKTKRGERGFEGSRRHSPYFRERADWQYVQGLLEATLRERMKFERSWIIKACKGARNLREVLRNVERELTKARGLSESVYTNLKAYLEIVLPEIEKTFFTDTIQLSPGINVMDLADLRDEVQGLVIASTMDAIYEKETDVVVVIPEAWKFCPEGRGNPVKHSAEKLIRQGAAIGIYLWFDSQDMAGVDKSLLKQVDNWILGRQREINEVEHTLSQVPVPKREKPKADEVMQLPIGHFFACYNDQVRKVYVQSTWISAEDAKKVALGKLSVLKLKKPAKLKGEDDNMIGDLEAELRDMRKRNADLEAEKIQAKKERDELEKAAAERLKILENNEYARRTLARREARPDFHEPKIQREVARGIVRDGIRGAVEVLEKADPVKAEIHLEAKDAPYIPAIPPTPVVLKVRKEESEIEVDVDKPIVNVDDSKTRGRMAIMIADGFFDVPRSGGEVAREAEARGWNNWMKGGYKPAMYNELKWFTAHYFLRKEGEQYRTLPGVTDRISLNERSRST